MPESGPRMPNQVTAVPLKAKFACAPAAMDSTAWPPLHANQPLSCNQPEPKLTDPCDSSKRCVAEGGGGGGAGLVTVTVTGADVVWLPAASRATAVSVCDPFGVPLVSQEIE